MTTTQQLDSHLFTIRVWIETADDGQIQYRGKLQHIHSGEIRHFRGCDALPPLMLEILQPYTDPTFVLDEPDQLRDSTE